MSDLFKQISLGHFIRAFLGGVAFFVGAVWVRHELYGDISQQIKTESLSIFLTCYLIGMILYILNRVTIIWLFDILRRLTLGDQADSWFMQKESAKRVLDQWMLFSPDGKFKVDLAADRLREWSDYCHAMYVCAIALVIGAFAGNTRYFESSEAVCPPLRVWMLAGIVLFVGYWNDYRRQVVANYLMATKDS